MGVCVCMRMRVLCIVGSRRSWWLQQRYNPIRPRAMSQQKNNEEEIKVPGVCGSPPPTSLAWISEEENTGCLRGLLLFFSIGLGSTALYEFLFVCLFRGWLECFTQMGDALLLLLFGDAEKFDAGCRERNLCSFFL